MSGIFQLTKKGRGDVHRVVTEAEWKNIGRSIRALGYVDFSLSFSRSFVTQCTNSAIRAQAVRETCAYLLLYKNEMCSIERKSLYTEKSILSS